MKNTYPKFDTGIRSLLGNVLFIGLYSLLATKSYKLLFIPVLVVAIHFWMRKRVEKYQYWYDHCSMIRFYFKASILYGFFSILISWTIGVETFIGLLIFLYGLFTTICTILIKRCDGKM